METTGRRWTPELTERYATLCQHYGMQGVHNNAGRGHENGSVESAHGHLKRRICQALILRGSNDFSTIEEYQAFITQQVMRHNRKDPGSGQGRTSSSETAAASSQC